VIRVRSCKAITGSVCSQVSHVLCTVDIALRRHSGYTRDSHEAHTYILVYYLFVIYNKTFKNLHHACITGRGADICWLGSGRRSNWLVHPGVEGASTPEFRPLSELDLQRVGHWNLDSSRVVNCFSTPPPPSHPYTVCITSKSCFGVVMLLRGRFQAAAALAPGHLPQ
jgi:hypothetical protein